jgi:hypothetical protein
MKPIINFVQHTLLGWKSVTGLILLPENCIRGEINEQMNDSDNKNSNSRHTILTTKWSLHSDNSTAKEYDSDLVIDDGSRINQDTVYDADTRHLYLTSQRLVSIKIESCINRTLK